MDIPKGAFLLEYRGKHHLMKDMGEKLKEYSERQLSYVFEYKVDNVNYWQVNPSFLAEFSVSFHVKCLQGKNNSCFMNNKVVNEFFLSGIFYMFTYLMNLLNG